VTAEQRRVPIAVHLNGDLASATRTLTSQGVTVSEPVTATGPLAVLSQLATPDDVPVGTVVRPVVVGATVVGFHVRTGEVVASLRQIVLGLGQRPPTVASRKKS
jgi:hypothetical protein